MLKSVILLFALACVTIHGHAQTSEPDAPKAIRDVLNATYDQPGTRVETDPIVVSGNHALADWTQGRLGGRALMRKVDGKWTIVLCAGNGIRARAALVQAGVPDGNARELARLLADAERKLPSQRLKQFSLFGTPAGNKIMGELMHASPASQAGHPK